MSAPYSVEPDTAELIRTLARSVTEDNDVGNTVLVVSIEPNEYVGFRVERVQVHTAGDPLTLKRSTLSVWAARRDIASAILERIDDV
jgi:hypothetical protein